MNIQKKEPIAPEISLKFSVFSLLMTGIVVLYHSSFRYYYPSIEEIGPVSIFYFFCVSGFFFYRGLETDQIAGRIKKRVCSLLVPYFLWNVIYAFLNFVPHGRLSDYSLKTFVAMFTVSPVCVPSWYLLTLFLFTLLSPVLSIAYRKKGTTAILLLLGVSLSLAGYVWFQGVLANVPFAGGYLIRMSQYLPAFLIGGALGTWLDESLRVDRKKCCAGIFASAIILFILSRTDPAAEVRLLLLIVLPIALWEAVPERLFQNLEAVRFITEPVFFLTMTHYGLIGFWENVLTTLQPGWKVKVWNACVVAAAVCSAYLIYYLLKAAFPGLAGILTGSRSGRLKPKGKSGKAPRIYPENRDLQDREKVS